MRILNADEFKAEKDALIESVSDGAVFIFLSMTENLWFIGIKFKYQRIISPLEGFNFLDCRYSTGLFFDAA